MPIAACPVKCEVYFTRVRGEHHKKSGKGLKEEESLLFGFFLHFCRKALNL